MVFQLPSERMVYGSLKLKQFVKRLTPVAIRQWYNRLRYGGMEMYYVPREKVVEHVSAHGGTVLDVAEREAGGGYRSATYYVSALKTAGNETA